MIQHDDTKQFENRHLIVGLTIICTALLLNLTRYVEPDQNVFMIDFQLLYAGSKAFVQREDPYNRPVLEAISLETSDDSLMCGGPFMYPPNTLILYSPFSLIDWNTAQTVMFQLNILLVLTIISALALVGDYHHSKMELLCLTAFVCATKFIHLGILAGQPYILSFAAGLFSLLLHKKKVSPLLSGLLLSVSFIKPTVAIAFGVHFLFHRRFLPLLWGASFTLGLSILALALAPPTALSSYFGNVSASFVPGGINDYAHINPVFYSLTDIRTLFYLLTDSRLFSTIGRYAVAFTFGLIFVLFRRTLRRGYLMVTFITFMSLFLVYHQALDTAVLLIVLVDIPPTALLKKLKYGIVLLIPLFFPVVGVLVRQQAYLPEKLYLTAILNVQLSLIILFVIWVIAAIKGRIPVKSHYSSTKSDQPERVHHGN